MKLEHIWAESKNTVVRKYGYVDWREFLSRCIYEGKHQIISDYSDEAAKLFSEEVLCSIGSRKHIHLRVMRWINKYFYNCEESIRKISKRIKWLKW